MKEWDALLSTALLGTERQPPQLPSAERALGAVLEQVSRMEPPRQVLSAAAALSLYRQSGWTPPVVASPASASAPPESRPACSLQAGAHLETMLAGRYREALAEWLDGLDRAGKRVPFEYLPPLLDHGRIHAELRSAITPVLGERGRWLAAHNPAWDYSSELRGPEDWQTGTRDARAGLLQDLRARNPGQARDLVQSTWAEEGPDDRARFLPLFRAGLSLADEPFLEAALDDRRKEVRRAATDLLAALPGSALGNRMVERVRPLVRLKRKLLGGAWLEVHLPDACDKSMVRDGLESRPPQHDAQGLGEKAWWLRQIVAATPLAYWFQTFEMTPPQLLDLARKSEWAAPLIEGWAQAALRWNDPTWAEGTLNLAGSNDALTQEILVMLPPHRREALALELLRTHGGPLRADNPALGLLGRCRHPWSPELTRRVLEGVRRRAAEGGDHSDWQVRSGLKEWALYMPPALLPEAEAGWPVQSPHWSTWESPVNDFLAILQFRHDLLKEIAR